MTPAEFEAWVQKYEREKRGLPMPWPLEIIETRPGNCECGSDSVGSGRHLYYCPKFVKDK
jgi:hypothetical protein